MTGSATFSQFSPWFEEAGTNLVAAETEHQDPEGKKTDYDQDIFRHVRNDADTWSQRLAPAPHLKMLTLKFLFLSDGRSQWSLWCVYVNMFWKCVNFCVLLIVLLVMV